jgi:Cu+-exporting ATPase
MDASRRSASLCPGCGKAVDPLRAGQVAILDGGFRYFCGASCKSSFVDATSKRPALEALTAEPPSVRSGAISATSGVRVQTPPPPTTREEPHFPTPSSEARRARESEREIAAEVAFERVLDEVDADVEPVEEEAPSTLRSKARTTEGDAEDALARAELAARSTEREHLGWGEERSETDAQADTNVDANVNASPKRGAVRWLARVAAVAPILGIALGVLAVVVSLAGEGGSALRLPFAIAAAAILVVCSGLGRRDASDPAPWFVAGPVVLAACGAVLSLSMHDARAESHAAYVGLAAAATLLVDLLVSRSRRDVTDARERVARALTMRVRVVRGEATDEIDAAQAKPGEQVVAEAGEMLGVDGIVAAGDAEVAPWMDSPVVLSKHEGDAVVAGSTIISGRLRVTATFTGAERAWLKLGHGRASRVDVAAPFIVQARRVVERGVPIASLLVGGAAYANNGGWPEVVIAASAGAFAVAGFAAVAAAALAHARGHIAAQRRGIVYKDADAFDGAARAEVAVVCSRGTILLGEPEIVVAEGAEHLGAGKSKSEHDPTGMERVLSLAAGAEMASSDAFAAAILRAARARGVRPESVRSALVHSGLGVTALAPNGDKVIVGSRAFLLKEKVSVAIADARTNELEAQGRSVLLVALGGRLIGLLALQDGLRPGARAAVQRLHDARIEPVFLSGEARDTCETIARALDIEHVRPEILPADRGAEVRALADGGRVVAAVGHPSSDDGALGAADVSVAMTAAGAAPGEWAVALASDDVRDAALALTAPRACRERAKSAALVGAAAQAVSLLGIAFGVAPPVVAPIVAVLAAGFVLAFVREPTTPTPARRVAG